MGYQKWSSLSVELPHRWFLHYGIYQHITYVQMGGEKQGEILTYMLQSAECTS